MFAFAVVIQSPETLLGPASYLVTAADLRPVQEANYMYVIKVSDHTGGELQLRIAWH